MQARTAPSSPESVGEAAPPEAPTSAWAAWSRSSSPSDRGDGVTCALPPVRGGCIQNPPVLPPHPGHG
eukprot:3047179-Alexandrium_andersonii.AAC.1